MEFAKYSVGVGDRFGRQGKAQLDAIIEAKSMGIDIVPVWNKSAREHSIIGTEPSNTRDAADRAVEARHYTGAYYVDADHVNLANVDSFVEHCDYFTLDVADAIGKSCTNDSLVRFVRFCEKYIKTLSIDGIDKPFQISKETVSSIGSKYLYAVLQAAGIYQYVRRAKGHGQFVTEISMDETDLPQTPLELFFILAALAMYDISVQTVAPKFTGRFNKGIDYSGDVWRFEQEFNEDVAVTMFAAKEFGFSNNLKLSIHSGSDKFSIYAPINRALKRFNCGLHIKTAGTTWLEEVIGLASAGGEGLEIAKEIYLEAFKKIDELCAPYAAVIEIDSAKLPKPLVVNQWSSKDFSNAVKHQPQNPAYNPHMRQLLHVSYKIAAQMKNRYTDALESNKQVIAECVKENLLNRHIMPVFSELKIEDAC